MRGKLGPAAAALVLCAALGWPGAAASQAAGPAESALRADIERAIKQLEAGAQGLVKWDGAERIDVRPRGDGAVAEIVNPRITIGPNEPKPARVAFDRIEISRAPAPDNATRFGIVFAGEAVLRGAEGEESRLALREATASTIVEDQSNRVREAELSIGHGRLDDKRAGDWLGFGPLSLAWRLARTGDGGWTNPVSFEVKGIEFFFSDGPVAGGIDRIAYGAQSAGPDLAALNRLRDRLDAIRERISPGKQVEGFVEVLPEMLAQFSIAQGEMSLERLVVRAATGEPVVELAKASIGGGATGLSGDTAALRVTIGHDGLALAASVLDADKVPRRVVLDIGLEGVETAPLRSMLEILKDRSDASKDKNDQRMMAAAARLNPTLRIYDLAVDTTATGVEATAELTGSPLAPKGYSARGDVAVRGWDALASLAAAAPMAEYLPLLREIGAAEPGPDGAPRVRFRIASAPPKWLTVNGNDVSGWFDRDGAGPGAALRPAHPAMAGNDVREVQRALAAANIEAPQNGEYDGATAVAVARFQKRHGLNVSGVVDAATRDRLGIKPEPSAPAVPPRRPSNR